MKQRMVDAAQRCIVVADGVKIGNISVVKVADLSEVDLLVTDSSAPSEVVSELSVVLPVEVAQ